MLKDIRYDNFCFKFCKGLNFINNNEIIDIAMTSFGGFTGAFNKGIGRRVELNDDEEALTVSTHLNMHNIDLYFSRCYTHFKSDTDTVDKKQDVVKYTKDLTANIDKDETHLPIIIYYNEATDFDEEKFDFNRSDVLTDKSYGYNNCLIVNNKFSSTQLYFMFSDFVCWQKSKINMKNQYYYNCVNMYKSMVEFIKYIGYNKIFYNVTEDSICVCNRKNDIKKISDLNKEDKIYIAVVLDIHMRVLMLNPNSKNIFNEEGCIGFTYQFDSKRLNNLTNLLHKKFKNFQLLF